MCFQYFLVCVPCLTLYIVQKFIPEGHQVSWLVSLSAEYSECCTRGSSDTWPGFFSLDENNYGNIRIWCNWQMPPVAAAGTADYIKTFTTMICDSFLSKGLFTWQHLDQITFKPPQRKCWNICMLFPQKRNQTESLILVRNYRKTSITPRVPTQALRFCNAVSRTLLCWDKSQHLGRGSMLWLDSSNKTQKGFAFSSANDLIHQYLFGCASSCTFETFSFYFAVAGKNRPNWDEQPFVNLHLPL